MKMISARRWLTLLVLLALCATPAQAQRRRRGSAAAVPSGPPATLTAMRILPYNEMTDAFEDDIADSDRALFNDLNLSFLVKVEVTGKAGEYSNRMVQVTVSQGRKQLVNRTAMVGIYNDAGKFTVPVWIYGPICQDTTIRATLTGQRRPSTITKTLRANCGE
ncbi:MAG TPA: hypothetical protein VJT74_05185 [Pyrinomonadaceae bacterium]|nr:hypothetical protein [Pyrinomonadaceae bacterium]